MDPIRRAFVDAFAGIRLSPPAVPFVSNVTGEWITTQQATSPEYWADHLRCTVLFDKGVERLSTPTPHHLLEAGPGRTLANLARARRAEAACISVTSVPGAVDAVSALSTMQNALAALWIAGVPIDWNGVHAGRSRRRIPLPTYPFERARYWIDPPKEEPADNQTLAARRLDDQSEWFYLPRWKQTLPIERLDRRASTGREWLVLADDSQLSESLVAAVRRSAGSVTVVGIGDRFTACGSERFTIDPRSRDHYDRLIQSLSASGRGPDTVVHLWSLSAEARCAGTPEDVARAQHFGFFSVLKLVQAFDATGQRTPLSIRVVTSRGQDVIGGEPVSPAAATVSAACRVIPQEYPHIDCALLDVDGDDRSDRAKWTGERLVAEMLAGCPEPATAYRGRTRWVPTIDAVNLAAVPAPHPILRRRGVYLIIGGLGRIGRTLAYHLATSVQARLALITSSGLPPREQWHAYLASADPADAVSQRIRSVLVLEEHGADVLVLTADASDRRQLAEAVAETERRFGSIDGVVAAAGIVDANAFRSVATLTEAECVRQFRPKIDGLFALERVLDGRALDFCVVVSSLSSFLGGLGYAAYAAANVFMDAFVSDHNYRCPSRRWMSVNWDAWRWTEKAPDAAAGSLVHLAMTPREAIEVFERVLSASWADQIAVSTSSLPARVAAWVESIGARAADRIITAAEPQREAEPAPVSKEPPDNGPSLTATERAVIDTWRHVLGIDRIDVDESFLDIGGNSLTAVQAISRLEQTLGVRVAIEEFIFQTAGQLASLCEQKQEADRAPRAVPPPPKPAQAGLFRTIRNAVRR
jgi:acyl transferase domain-containing protein/acyl carrier protein